MKSIKDLGSFAVKNDGSEDFKKYVLEPLNEMMPKHPLSMRWNYYGIDNGNRFAFYDKTPDVPILSVAEVKEYLQKEEGGEENKHWNYVVAEIVTANLIGTVKPDDVLGIANWKQKVIEKLKSMYAITPKQ